MVIFHSYVSLPEGSQVARKNQVSINKNVDSLLIHDGFLMVSVGTQYTTYLYKRTVSFRVDLFSQNTLADILPTSRTGGGLPVGKFCLFQFVWWCDATTYIIIYGFVQNVISWVNHRVSVGQIAWMCFGAVGATIRSIMQGSLHLYPFVRGREYYLYIKDNLIKLENGASRFMSFSMQQW